MIHLRSEFFVKCAEEISQSSFSKSTASAKISFGSKGPKYSYETSHYPMGNPSVNLTKTMAQFHNKHDLEDLNKKGIKPPDQFTSSQIEHNSKRLSHLPDRRILLAHLRGR